MPSPRVVIGTAGHVDHGKTSLVRALTGVDLDRLPEERARGITIALGFTPLRLADGRVAGLIDVPGHERLVRTMVAGASGMDAVMLCVSAVEGVMPQTREHLAILELLGLRSGIVVLTMADLVDPDLLELAAEEVREQVAGSFLAGAPILPASALTGAGIDVVRAALSALPDLGHDARGAFRLPVDRAFARRGFGTVVTGTAWSGYLADGSEVEILPGGRRARVRGIQVHGESVGAAEAGARTALNLAAVEVGEVARGAWIATPGAVPAAMVLDVRYHPIGEAPEDEFRALVLHGTAEVPARVVPLGGGFAQLRATDPIPALPGDRFIVRRESPAATLGGGEVLDPWARVVRRAGVPQAIAELTRLSAGDRMVLLERAGPAGLTEAEARLRGVSGEKIGDRVLAPTIVEGLRGALAEALARFHAEHPVAPGANRKELHSGALRALDERAFLALLDAEARAGRITVDGARVRLPGFSVELADDAAAWRAKVLEALATAAWNGLDALPEHPARESLTFLLRDRGEIEVVEGRYYGGAALTELVAAVRRHFTTHAQLDPAGFKEITGLSRRTAIPLLEWLDAKGVTRRVGDARALTTP